MHNQEQLARISAAIHTVQKRYLQDATLFISGKASLYEINNGLCDDFAEDLIRELGVDPCHGDLKGNFVVVETANFYRDPENDERWDRALLKKHWNIGLPTGVTWAKLDQINFGQHVWLAAKTSSSGTWMHFDAECMEGVESFFDLPIFVRYRNDTWPTPKELAALPPDAVWVAK